MEPDALLVLTILVLCYAVITGLVKKPRGHQPLNPGPGRLRLRDSRRTKSGL